MRMDEYSVLSGAAEGSLWEMLLSHQWQSEVFAISKCRPCVCKGPRFKDIKHVDLSLYFQIDFSLG